MLELRKWAWAAVTAAAAVSPAVAQQTGGTTVTGTGGISAGGMTGGIGLGGGSTALGGGGQGGGGGLGGGGGGLGGGGGQGTQIATIEAPPQISAPTGSASSSLAASNFLAGYYGNPYYQGLRTTQAGGQPGGFGTALYGNATTGGGRGATGAGGLGGGRGGLGGQNSANQSGIIIPLPVQINYVAQMQFPTPPVPATKILSEIRSIIDNTNAIANSKAIQIITDANNNVTLRGSVKDADESGLIEGLVRLTPGVGAIKNELAISVASK